MDYVRPKKHLGQHFLKDQNIAKNIADSLKVDKKTVCLEIGPGTGVLTQFLINRNDLDMTLIEIDTESVMYLNENYPEISSRIKEEDFLKMDLSQFESPFVVIGNFPYNISSQIFFKVLDYKYDVSQVVCMIQKEVAERIAEKPGKKTYGILSVLLQAYYDIEYLFTVHENVFIPPPKVKSGVIRLKRNATMKLDCNEVLFKNVIKTTFNQRRKQIRNSIKPLANAGESDFHLLTKRPEQLSVAEFVELTNFVDELQKKAKETI